jgi:pyruvate dehydrogenase E2 component (dihydrolipoamide acetyltransferase)
MDEAKLVTWLVSPGDRVHKGQIIAEVETDKANLEVECWDEGIVEELLIQPGPVRLPVGTLLARIRPSEAEVESPVVRPTLEEPTAPMVVPHHGEPSPPIRHLAHELGVDITRMEGTGKNGLVTRGDIRTAALRTAPPPPAAAADAEGRPRLSPRAKAMAAELGLEIEGISGTGPDGMVVARDVEEAASRPQVTEGEDRHLAMRRAISRSMSHSNREIPHYYLATHIDLERTLSWLEARNEDRPITERILPAALLLKATALALRETPDLNGHYLDDGFHPSDSIHLGVAVSLREGGLVAPAIHDADQLDLDTMMTRLRDLVNRARAWKLRGSEMSDPTITVTNLGDRGVETAFPVIIPPQVAIVGFGKVVEVPVVADNTVVAHRVVHATLAGDHRVTDGHRGGLFLDALDRLLQEPERL